MGPELPLRRSIANERGFLLSIVLLISATCLVTAKPKDVHYVCYSQEAGRQYTYTEASDSRINVNVDVSGGYRTCTFKTEIVHNFYSYLRYLVDIPVKNSPDCDESDNELFVGHDENSLERVCNDKVYSKKFSTSFIVRVKQAYKLPKTDGVHVQLSKLEIPYLKNNCNKTFGNYASEDVAESEINIAQSFQPGELELPYNCFWVFSYKRDFSRMFIELNHVNLRSNSSNNGTVECGGNSISVSNSAGHNFHFITGEEVDKTDPLHETCSIDDKEIAVNLDYPVAVIVQVKINQQPLELQNIFNFTLKLYENEKTCNWQGTTTQASADKKILENFGYPGVYSPEMCYWTIETDKDHQVEIEIIDVDLGSLCNQHSLEIFDGDSSKSKKLVSFCKTIGTNKTTYRSSNHVLFVKFNQEDIGERYAKGRGFQLRYFKTNSVDE